MWERSCRNTVRKVGLGAKLLLWWRMSTTQQSLYARLCATFFTCYISLDLYYNPASKVSGNQGSERLSKRQSQNSGLGHLTLESKFTAVTPYRCPKSWRTMDPRLRSMHLISWAMIRAVRKMKPMEWYDPGRGICAVFPTWVEWQIIGLPVWPPGCGAGAWWEEPTWARVGQVQSQW